MVIAPTQLQAETADRVRRLEEDGPTWARIIFPRHFNSPFGRHHLEAWDWAWSIRPGVKPRPFIELWGRNLAKTQTSQGIATALGARRIRNYCVIVSGIQEQADEKVSDMASMLEDSVIGTLYPGMGDRAVGKYGQSKGWRRNRLRTASGFIVDALGVDTSSRGKKVDAQRPDIVILDDIDDAEDSPTAADKKVRQLTRKILPIATKDAVIIGAQNLIRPDGFFGRMMTGAEIRGDYLQDRIFNGPLPALIDPTYEEVPGPEGELVWTVTSGTPTWPGFLDLPACQDLCLRYGVSAFRVEVQNEPASQKGGIYDHLHYTHMARTVWEAKLRDPGFRVLRVATWLDPAISAKDTSDSQAIQCDALGSDGKLYRLFSFERRCSPVAAVTKALQVANEYGGSYIGIETDQGGDAWDSVYREAKKASQEEGVNVAHISLRTEKAGSVGGKVERGSRWQLPAYERGKVVHVEGTHHILESALNRFPKFKPWDLHDAAAWAARDLLLDAPAHIAEPEGRIPRPMQSRR